MKHFLIDKAVKESIDIMGTEEFWEDEQESPITL